MARTRESIIREAIGESSKREDIRSDLTNRIINKYINIVSYVSLANKLQAGKINLNKSLLIFDEAHQFLYPLKQFESKQETPSARTHLTHKQQKQHPTKMEPKT